MPGRMTLLQEHETVAEVRVICLVEIRMTLLQEHETVAEVRVTCLVE